MSQIPLSLHSKCYQVPRHLLAFATVLLLKLSVHGEIVARLV
jgi:hypothetical protein